MHINFLPKIERGAGLCNLDSPSADGKKNGLQKRDEHSVEGGESSVEFSN